MSTKEEVMEESLNNFEFYKTFRLKFNKGDKVYAKIFSNQQQVADEVLVKGMNLNGLSFCSSEKIDSTLDLQIKLYTKRWFNQWELDLSGSIVRSFTSPEDESLIHYGIKLDHHRTSEGEEDIELKYFLKDFVYSMNFSKLKKSLIESALSERDINAVDGLELYSLLSSLYTDSIHGDIQETIASATQMMNASTGRVYTINIETDKLENQVSAGGVSKKAFDFRKKTTGSVFISGNLVNLDYSSPVKVDDEDTAVKSIISYPLFNKNHIIIGVIEFINKKDDQRFSRKDEFTIRLLSQVFSTFFKEMSPSSKSTQVLQFNKFLREDFLYLGDDIESKAVRDTIRTIKCTNENILIVAEKGLGKNFMAKSIHAHGVHSKNEIHNIDCSDRLYIKELIKNNFEGINLKEEGTIILSNVTALSLVEQRKVYEYLLNSFKRIITTSTNDLDSLVKRDSFYSDFYNLISKTYIHLNPLRNRKEKVLDFANYFLSIEMERRSVNALEFSAQAQELIMSYDWPGNFKELEATIRKSLFKHHNIDPTFKSKLINIELKEHSASAIIHRLASAADHSIPLSSHMEMLRTALKAK